MSDNDSSSSSSSSNDNNRHHNRSSVSNDKSSIRNDGGHRTLSSCSKNSTRRNDNDQHKHSKAVMHYGEDVAGTSRYTGTEVQRCDLKLGPGSYKTQIERISKTLVKPTNRTKLKLTLH